MQWVTEGDRVWAVMARPNMSILCTVECAMGHTARVVNDELGYDDWHHVDELRKYILPQPRPQTGIERMPGP